MTKVIYIDSVGLFVLFFSFKYKKRVMELVCKMHVHAAIFINSLFINLLIELITMVIPFDQIYKRWQ